MKLLLCFTLVALVALSAALPSDIIQIGPKPGLLALSGATPESAKAIAATNENLTAFQGGDLPDLGHHFSGLRQSIQIINESITPVQAAFAEELVANLTSIGNVTGNVTVINGTMAWF